MRPKKRKFAKKSPQKIQKFPKEKEVQVQTQILDTARKTVLKKGYEALSIRTLMAELDYSPMVFYRYFKNKRALLHHLWIDIFADLVHSMERYFDTTKPDKNSRIKQIVIGNIEFWLKHPDKYKIVYLHPDYLEEVEEDRFFVESPLIQMYLERIVQIISWEKKELKLRKDLQEMEILRSMVVLVTGVSHSLITVAEFPWGSPKKMYHTLIDTWYRGLQ